MTSSVKDGPGRARAPSRGRYHASRSPSDSAFAFEPRLDRRLEQRDLIVDRQLHHGRTEVELGQAPPAQLLAGTRSAASRELLVDIVSHPDGRSAEHVGGSPANVALGLARLGHDTHFATLVGTDERGARCAAHVEDGGVHLLPGSVSPEQKAWRERLESQGLRVEVCKGWEAARDVVLDYLNQPQP